MPLEKLLAKTVGKRLDRQAQKVRTTLARATKVAEVVRSDLLTVLPGGALALDGAVRRAELDAAEKQAYEHARDEVYIGFHELEALLPGYVAPSRYPELVALHEPAGPTTLPPIPGPDLVAALGPAACEEMRVWIQEEGGHRCLEPADSDVWWAVYLPAFVKDLRRERDAARLQASEADKTVNITNAALEREQAAGLELRTDCGHPGISRSLACQPHSLA
jgi:hypothetical protein